MFRVVVFLSTILLLSWPGASGAETTAERFRSVFDALQAHPVACPGDLGRYGVAAEAKCFAVAGDFRAVRREVERQFEVEGWPLSGWTRGHGYRARSVPGSGEVFVVLFDAKQWILAVVPHRPCPVDPAVHVAEGASYQPPRRISRESPHLPDEAAVARRDGAAIVRVVIGEDGSVGDVCLMHVDPPGYGFEEAAARAVLKWRYEPARLDGKPVSIYSIVWVSWSSTLTR